jgi:NADPH:quinone reductase-like Zn-dependent oxidoreductase
LTFAAAAALPTVGSTAWRALVVVAKLKGGQSVLINAAAGGVGQAAVAIAQTMGAVVSVRVGPSSIAEMAKREFASVVDYSQPIPARLHHSFDVVLDCHGGLTAREERSLIKSGGVAVDIVPTLSNMRRAIFSSRHRLVRAAPSQDILRKVTDLASSGKLLIPVNRTSSLSEAISLIKDLETGKRGPGKAVIVLD